MESDRPDPKSVKARAREELGSIEGVEGVGIGQGSLRVYVRNRQVERELPIKFMELDVEAVVVGDIHAQSS